MSITKLQEDKFTAFLRKLTPQFSLTTSALPNALQQPPPSLVDHQVPVSFDILLDLHLAPLPTQLGIPARVLDSLAQHSAPLGLDFIVCDLRHAANLALALPYRQSRL
jgi:hypothetical protein